PPHPYDTLFTSRRGDYPFISGVPDRPISPDDLQYIVDRYDAGIRFVDDNIRSFFSDLSKNNKLKNTMVIILADHGEEFLDHGALGHRAVLYEELIHIPLIILPPGNGFSQKRIKGIVQTIDIYPTVLDLLGICFNHENTCGESLVPFMKTGESSEKEAYSEYYNEVLSIRDMRYKYISSHNGTEEQLYDIENDPREIRNIASYNREIVEGYREEMGKWLDYIQEMDSRLNMKPGSVPIDNKTMEKLKSHGYLK
ncbi:MAG: sulfatase-like hydrolase/transferase, partial [bacterium]